MPRVEVRGSEGSHDEALDQQVRRQGCTLVRRRSRRRRPQVARNIEAPPAAAAAAAAAAEAATEDDDPPQGPQQAPEKPALQTPTAKVGKGKGGKASRTC